MPSSARDDLQGAPHDFDGWLAREAWESAVSRCVLRADLTLAALVEEHELHEVLEMLGGERQGRVGLLGIKREWHFLEGDSDE